MLAVLLALFLAFGGAGSGSSDGDRESDGSAHSSADRKDEAAQHSGSDDAADHRDGASYTDRMRRRLEDRGLTVRRGSSDLHRDCVEHSYGAVHDYLRDHPCVGIERAWYEVDDGGDTAVVSAAWVGMPDSDSAGRLRSLVDDPGAGNLTELSREDGPHRDLGYSGRYYRSDRDGNTVGSLQVEPLQDTDGSRDVAGRAVGAVGID